VTDVLLNKVIPFFKGLIKDTEQEIRSNALEQFALMVRVMSEREDSESTISDLLTVLDDLIKVPPKMLFLNQKLGSILPCQK
jgi:hypothetical protein